MVTSWLFNSLSKDLAASVIYSESAQAMWKDLKERFSQTNAPHLFQIEREIHDLAQDTMSVGTYFTKLKGMWDELNALSPTPSCSCGAMTEVLEYQRRQRTMKFLMGLHESYSTVRGQILLMEPLPTINKVFSLLVQEERQRTLFLQSMSLKLLLLRPRATLMVKGISRALTRRKEEHVIDRHASIVIGLVTQWTNVMFFMDIHLGIASTKLLLVLLLTKQSTRPLKSNIPEQTPSHSLKSNAVKF